MVQTGQPDDSWTPGEVAKGDGLRKGTTDLSFLYLASRSSEENEGST